MSLIKNFYITNISLLLITSFLLALPVNGKILSPSGNPLPSVYIHNQTQDIWTLSDDFGGFSLYRFAETGDTLILFHVGYKNHILVIPPEKLPIQIIMEKSVITLISLVKTENRIAQNTHNITLGTFTKSTKSSEKKNIRLLRKIPGLNIRSYGGPAGITTAGLDGGASRHTKIMTAGIDLTNAQNGHMDISQIPAPFVESERFLPYG